MYSRYILRIVVPTLLTVALFVVTIFLILIPALERGLLERKREMIRELTTSAWNILASFEQEVAEGRMSRAAAQEEAIRQFRNLHYGPQMKDYFWINDLTPRMIVHPYRHELEGQDLSRIEDPTGKRLFVEFAAVARAQGGGFVQYQWQWKDDARRTVPKLSYVKLFAPWGWVIGTGIYLDDVADEIHATSRRLALSSGGILLAVLALLGVILHQGLNAERARREAESALRASEERYRMLVESAGESIILALGGDRLYANANTLQLLGYTAEEFAALGLRDVIRDFAAGGAGAEGGDTAGDPFRPAPAKHESELIGKDGRTVPVLLSFAPIVTGGQEGVIVVATDITARKATEAELDRSHSALRDRFEDLR
ncbi:MAG: cache domain-containing protein, partial [Verrucomicrobia bacterium]|nr:cache domain-containing protein [Verrucomicrobiota bacterium]